MPEVPEQRIRAVNRAEPAPDGEYVLYWMIANRRTQWNFALDRAVEWCRELEKPLVVLEALTSSYEWASDRFHAFVLRGMADNAERFQDTRAAYYPYVEPEKRAGRGLVQALAERACVVVTDEYPAFFLPKLVERAAKRAKVRVEAVDSNGLLPMRAAEKAFPTAYAFRRFLQKELPRHFDAFPRQDGLRALPDERTAHVPQEILSQWPRTPLSKLRDPGSWLKELPIDHDVEPTDVTGGSTAGKRVLQRFLRSRLDDYDESRNEPEADATSGLSPYLHFGHIAAHDVFRALGRREEWSPDRLSDKATGKRSGWWSMGKSSEAFLDQLITWRELGFNGCYHMKKYDRFESLPDWARATLEKHADDPRESTYTPDELDAAETHDDLWNAAQNQLKRDGKIHNYLRMLWGKNILAWSPKPWDALDVLIELNNKYALDGRDPNSYSGIFWCLGRYDRPWGPEREIFGTVRYMTSKNTARKFSVGGYLERYATVEA